MLNQKFGRTGLDTMSRTQARKYFHQDQKLNTILTQNESWIAIYANTQLISEYLFHKGTTPNTLIPGTDASASVITVTNADTLIVLSYTPYGNLGNHILASGRLRYNGELLEKLTNCYLLGNYRLYSAPLMRFLSADAYSPFAAGGINPYAYCENDPVNHADPSGHGRIPNANSRPSSPTRILLNKVAAKLKILEKNNKLDSQRKSFSTTPVNFPYENFKPAEQRINANKALIDSIKKSKLPNKNDAIDLVAASTWAIADKNNLGTAHVTGIRRNTLYGKHIIKPANELSRDLNQTIKKTIGEHTATSIPNSQLLNPAFIRQP
ncbi:RHS repeat-associated core domain-containing protein [Pseudomonas asiatica]|uniref:RHS repeat-associated core domain-containing protein n=1 Tax=Pseudomonas asiatica TaxID=2219225 RepID=UPI00166D13AF|nr:RHS repeat-associated core domain-containing protein [Pseudomonas asiatica]QNT41290.1 RHS repeat-associated core domain-containing protein [Pseudomonas asiatica]